MKATNVRPILEIREDLYDLVGDHLWTMIQGMADEFIPTQFWTVLPPTGQVIVLYAKLVDCYTVL